VGGYNSFFSLNNSTNKQYYYYTGKCGRIIVDGNVCPGGSLFSFLRFGRNEKLRDGPSRGRTRGPKIDGKNRLRLQKLFKD
jgi:hypothetical protein